MTSLTTGLLPSYNSMNLMFAYDSVVIKIRLVRTPPAIVLTLL